MRRKRSLPTAGLILLWVVLLVATWGRWGSVTDDCGRELSVARDLALGKTLYSDVWYLYQPAGPYVNALLFRVFGIHLSVLYLAGAGAGLGSALLYLFCGLRLGSLGAGWAAGAILLVEAFVPSVFCFPLPYAYASVYGCFASAIVLWCCIAALDSPRPWRMVVGASCAAAFAFSLKLEFGVGCWATLVVLLALFATRDSFGQVFGKWLLAILPGVLLSVAMLAWCFSLRGPAFIFNENWIYTNQFNSTSVHWLASNGMIPTPRSLLKAAASLPAVFLWVAYAWLAKRWGLGWKSLVAGIIPAGVILALAALSPEGQIAHILFPPAMGAVDLAIACVLAWFLISGRKSPNLPLTMGACAAFLMGLRSLFGNAALGYAIYFQGPVVLMLLVMAAALFDFVPATWKRPAAALPFVATIFAVAILTIPYYRTASLRQPLANSFGTLRVPPQNLEPYRAALEFAKDAQGRGDLVSFVPEDTAFYFLTGHEIPTRFYQFTPGQILKRKISEELFRQLERVRWVVWSNRRFPEYGEAEFGVDFDQDAGDYIKSHYRIVRKIPATQADGWGAAIWERVPGL